MCTFLFKDVKNLKTALYKTTEKEVTNSISPLEKVCSPEKVCISFKTDGRLFTCITRNNYCTGSIPHILVFVDKTKVTIQGTVAKPEAKKIAIMDGTNEVAFTYIVDAGPCKSVGHMKAT